MYVAIATNLARFMQVMLRGYPCQDALSTSPPAVAVPGTASDVTVLAGCMAGCLVLLLGAEPRTEKIRFQPITRLGGHYEPNPRVI